MATAVTRRMRVLSAKRALERPDVGRGRVCVCHGQTDHLGRRRTIAPTHSRPCYSFSISASRGRPYRHFCTGCLGENRVCRLDLEKVHRFAPNLNVHQLWGACSWFQQGEVDTETFIDYLQTMRLASNVELEWLKSTNLHGVDDMIESRNQYRYTLQHGEREGGASTQAKSSWPDRRALARRPWDGHRSAQGKILLDRRDLPYPEPGTFTR